MRNNERELTEYFYRRLGTYAWPQSFFEGAMKGAAYGLPAFASLLLFDTSGKAWTFFYASALIGGSVGLKNQLPRNRLTFFERGISPMPPENKAEGFLKGFSAAFSLYWMLVVSKLIKFTPENMLFICMAMSILATGGLAWGYSNEMRHGRG